MGTSVYQDPQKSHCLYRTETVSARKPFKPPPMFMAFRTSSTAAILVSLSAPAALLAAPQDLRNFDDFIHHVRTEAQSGDAERIMDCFADFVVQEEGCEPVAIGDILGQEAQRFGWKATGRDVARFADGFVLMDTDGTMTNLHARARGQSHLLSILGNRVKLRRSPGLEGEVIALLDQGALPGQLDAGRWTVNRDGTDWTPVRLEHPEFGKVKGYIGSDYVRPTRGHGDLQLTASFDGTRWALTGYDRTRSDLVVNHDCPTP